VNKTEYMKSIISELIQHNGLLSSQWFRFDVKTSITLGAPRNHRKNQRKVDVLVNVKKKMKV
jgi:hypothetical protein